MTKTDSLRPGVMTAPWNDEAVAKEGLHPIQLYNFSEDRKKQNTVWDKLLEVVKLLTDFLKRYKEDGRSVPEKIGK